MKLESAFLKLNWAHQQIEQLDVEIQSFFVDENREFITEYEPDFFRAGHRFADGLIAPDQIGMWNIYLHFEKQAPTTRWLLMVGNIVNDLRSALDHSVYAISKLCTQDDFSLIEHRLQFPIASAAKDFKKQASNWLPGVPQEAMRIIEQAQPIEDPDHPLSLLKSLSNTDKHRFVRFGLAFLKDFTVFDTNSKQTPPPSVTLNFRSEVGPSSVLDLSQDILVGQTSFGSNEENRNANLQVKGTFELIFDSGETASHQNVPEALRQITGAVRQILETLELALSA